MIGVNAKNLLNRKSAEAFRPEEQETMKLAKFALNCELSNFDGRENKGCI